MIDDDIVARGTQVVIPKALQQRVLQIAHEGHPGIVRMKQRCRATVWWPGIDKRIEQHVKDCESCCLSEKAGSARPAPLQPVPWPQKPWQDLQIDIFGEVVAAPHNERFLVVVHDRHSKWPEIATTGTVTTTSVINILEKIFTRWGLPESVTTDNGPQFVSDQFEAFLAGYDIRHNLTSRYNPQANGGVERLNRVLKESLKASLAEGKKFDEAIQIFLRTYRSTPHAITGVTPAELMINRNLRLGLNVLQPRKPSTDNMKAKASEIAARQEKAKAYTDQRRRARQPQFRVGDWVRVARPMRKHKLATALSSPKQIKKLIGSNAFLLSDNTRWNARRLVASKPGNGIEDDISFPFPEGEGDLQPSTSKRVEFQPRRSGRQRRRPQYLNDYQ